MDIKEFAEKYRVRLNDKKHERKYRVSAVEDVVYGRFGEIAEDKTYGDVMAVRFIATPRNTVLTGALRNRYRKALADGLTLKCRNGEIESTFHFDPANERQARLALKLVGARVRRKMGAPSAAQIAVQTAFADRRRQSLQTVAA